MTKSEYLSRFSKAVKWRLSYQEAAEVMGDYEELFRHSGKEEAEVCRELGSPGIAAGHLSRGGQYVWWLAAFGIQMLPLLIVFALLIITWPAFPSVCSPPDLSSHTILILAGVGILVSLLWFRPQKNYRDGRIPKEIFFALGLLLMTFFAVVGMWAFCLHRLPSGDETAVFAACLTVAGIIGAGTLSAFLGAAALLKSRVCDRRWRAVYILALVSLLIHFFLLGTLVYLDLSGGAGTSVLHILDRELKACLLLGGAGILISGGSLC